MAIDRSRTSEGLRSGLLRGRSPVVPMVMHAQHLWCRALRGLAHAGVGSGPGATPAFGGNIRHKPFPMLLTVALVGSPQAHLHRELKRR